MSKFFDDRSYSFDFERSFDFIWDKVVLPVLSIVESEVESEFKSKTKFECIGRYDFEYKDRIKDFYREKREWLKAVYLPHEKHPVLDEHKLGALWCRSLLALKPFYFNFKVAEKYVKNKFSNEDCNLSTNNSEWFVKNIYCNYRASFLISVGVVYLYLLYDCKTKGEEVPDYLYEAYDYFLNEKTLRCPITTVKHNDFETSCIIALQKNDVLGRGFDYLMYAIMLFQLEHYNKMCYYMQKNGVSIEPI